MEGIDKTEPYIIIDGLKYSAYRPWDCRYCYFWEGKKKGCNQKECYYLIRPEDLVPKDPLMPGRCPGCPYGRVHLCIGYCTRQLLDEMKKKRGRGQQEVRYDCRKRPPVRP